MAVADDPRTRQTDTQCRVLGIDGDGWEHIYDSERERVIVISELGIDYQLALHDSDGNLADWMKFVAAKRGWLHEQWVGYKLAEVAWGGAR